MNEEKQSFQDLDEKFSNMDKKFSKGGWDSEKQSNQTENLDMKSSIKQIKIEIIDQAKERIWKTEDKGKKS
jgi:hypothetical protein